MAKDKNGGGGYCKPPKHSQFKKGQSGNPKGRPKNANTVGEAFAKTFVNTKWKVRNGKDVNGIEIFMMKLFEGVNAGNPTALKLFAELAQQYAPEEIKIIPPFVPSRAELAEYYAHELDDDEFSGKPKRH